MRIQLCSLLLASTTLAAAAHAEEAPAIVAATPAGTAATAADPNLDRGFVLPTAMTQPAGSVTYNNYELLLHGVSYGLTDRLQLSATVLAPIVKEMPFVGIAALKGQVYRGERLHLALQGSLGGGDGTMFGGVGALSSVCLRQDCSSLLSASATWEFLTSGSTGNAVIYGLSAVHRVGAHVKLLAEVASAANTKSADLGDGALVSYGVRFYSGSIASDLGFMKPVGGDAGGPFLMGIPFASVSYRGQ